MLPGTYTGQIYNSLTLGKEDTRSPMERAQSTAESARRAFIISSMSIRDCHPFRVCLAWRVYRLLLQESGILRATGFLQDVKPYPGVFKGLQIGESAVLPALAGTSLDLPEPNDEILKLHNLGDIRDTYSAISRLLLPMDMYLAYCSMMGVIEFPESLGLTESQKDHVFGLYFPRWEEIIKFEEEITLNAADLLIDGNRVSATKELCEVFGLFNTEAVNLIHMARKYLGAIYQPCPEQDRTEILAKLDKQYHLATATENIREALNALKAQAVILGVADGSTDSESGLRESIEESLKVANQELLEE